MKNYTPLSFCQNKRLLLFLLLFLGFISTHAQSDILVVKDTYVRGGTNADTNFGSDPLLWTKQAGGAASTRRTYLQFDLSSVSENIDTAILNMTVESVNNGPDNYTVKFISDDSWTEEGLTWNTEPVSGGDIISITGPNDVSEFLVTFDITSAVAQELAGDKVLSMVIVADGVANMKFHSKEGTGATPVLKINGGAIEPPPAPESNLDFSQRMGTCDFNDGNADVNTFNAAEAVQAAGLSYTRIGIFPEFFLDGNTPTPQAIDDIVLLLYKEGIQPMLLVEHNFNDHGALGNEQKWFNIGAAFATRFEPNSPFLVQNGITDWGITQYQSINEPLVFLPPGEFDFPIAEYVNATKGFANGVHSVEATLQVSPGGLQEVPLFLNLNPYMNGLAELFNDGTLDALDIHRYYDRNQPLYSLENKVASHQVLIDQIKTEYNITTDFKVWSTEYNARGAGSDEENAKDFVTATWDLLTVKDNEGNNITDLALTFRTYLPVSSNRNLGMALSDFPFLGNPKGIAHQMMANLTKGFKIVSGDEEKGVDILESDTGEKMWAFHNRTGWSSIVSNSFEITDLPQDATIVEVYRYNSWDALSGSTGTPNPAETIEINGQSSVLIEGLETGETYMFIAKSNADFNEMPSVSINFENEITSLVEGDTLKISANASDADGISEVVFYAGPSRLAELTEAPYTINWNDIPAGTTTILAIAKDTKGTVRMATKSVTAAHPNNGLNLIAEADNYVKGGQTDADNFGDASSLLIKTAGGDNLKRRILLKFKLGEIPTVQKATLRMRVSRTSNANHSVYFVADDEWEENKVTWNNQPDIGAELTSNIVGEEGRWTDFDVTGQVVAEQLEDGIVSLALRTSSTAIAEYFSKESALGNEPRLVLEVSPALEYEFPDEGTIYDVDQPIMVKVNAVSTDKATVEKVDFFVEDELISTVESAPYLFETSRSEVGIFEVKAVATDSEGKTSTKILPLTVSDGGTAISVEADTYVRGGGNADNNFGGNSDLQVKTVGAAFTRRTFLKFDLSQVVDDVQTAEIKLRVARNDGGNAPNNIYLVKVENDSWDELGLTWNNQPVTSDTLAIQSRDSILNVGDLMILDIKDVVAEEVNGDKTLSLAIISDGSANFNLFSKESGLENTPQIVVNEGIDTSGIEPCEGLGCIKNENIDFYVVGRYGDNRKRGWFWETAIVDKNGYRLSIKDKEGFVWTNRKKEAFSISYDKASGQVNYTLGENSLSWSHKPNLTHESVIAFSQAVIRNSGTYITDMTINGQSQRDIYAYENSNGLTIPILNPDDNGFEISGNITFSWKENNQFNFNSFYIYLVDDPDAVNGVVEQLSVSPNPIQNQSNINYAINANSDVNFKIYSLLGYLVAQKTVPNVQAGEHIIAFGDVLNGRNIRRGIYFVRMNYNNSSLTTKVVKR